MRGRVTGDARPELLALRNAAAPLVDYGGLAHTRQGM
jgi:hypothetical protein